MADTRIAQQLKILDNEAKLRDEKSGRKKARKKANGYEPPNLGKAIHFPIADFSDPKKNAEYYLLCCVLQKPDTDYSTDMQCQFLLGYFNKN
ncbi:hypothetical protein JXQ70_11765 [bacterium]|nr:hypothetical protein [bacterium]